MAGETVKVKSQFHAVECQRNNLYFVNEREKTCVFVFLKKDNFKTFFACLLLIVDIVFISC